MSKTLKPSSFVRGEAKLPDGEPAGKGIRLDEDLSGQRTFAKPQDDTTEYPPVPPLKTREITLEWDGYVDENDYGEGAVSVTDYPYRDGIPNIHNASFVAQLYKLKTAPVRVFKSHEDIRVASTSEQILSGLDSTFQQRAKSCSVDLKRADVRNMRWVFSVDCGNGEKAVKIKAIRPRANVTNFGRMDLEISCTCPAWRWLGPEFHAKGEGFLLGKPQGTASSPDIKDPERDNRVCKHVAAALSVTRGWTVPKAKATKPRKKKAEESDKTTCE